MTCCVKDCVNSNTVQNGMFAPASEWRSKWMSVWRRRRNAFVFGWPGLSVSLAAMALNVVALRATTPTAQQDSAWTAPPAARAVKNPVPVTPEGLKEAGELFQQTCVPCHGVKGAGDGIQAHTMTPRPANFADGRRMNKETDGELFWKMSTGRGAMPSWQLMPENLRWELVSYLRVLASKSNSPGKKDSVTK